MLTDMVWDETVLNRQRTARMRMMPSAGEGVLIFADTGFEQQGRHSVGVARQYTETAGQVTNCQVTVNCHYAERTLAWPVATGLYLPQAWAEDAARRQQAHGPEDVPFQTKAELALVLLAEAKACGVRHACVTCEADYGDNPQEAKTELGWEQYQGRRWDGFHRHALTVRLSYSFLVWLQGRAREHRKVSGRPRAAFSPSPGPPPRAAAGGPSPGERMAALYCYSRIDRTRAH